MLPALWMWPGMMPILHCAGRDDAGAVRADRGATLRCALEARLAHADHVDHRDAFGDADDELAARVDRFEDRVGGAGRRNEDARSRSAPVSFTASFDGVEDGHLCLRTSRRRAPGVTPRDDLRAVLDHLLRVERARAAGDALDESLVSLSTRMLICRPPFATAATIFCAPSAIVVGGLNREAALAQDLAPELDVRAFEAHDERHLEPELLRRGDDARRDDVALHDAAEDVDEDRLHLRALQDHLEGLGDLLLRSRRRRRRGSSPARRRAFRRRA